MENGYYPPPADILASPIKMLRNAARFIRDVPAVNLRRRLKANSDVFQDVTTARRPRYYMQNFHYQSGGWLTDDSAALYDHQVEVLFTGGADAMRRQALVPIGDWLRVHRAEGWSFRCRGGAAVGGSAQKHGGRGEIEKPGQHEGRFERLHVASLRGGCRVAGPSDGAKRAAGREAFLGVRSLNTEHHSQLKLKSYHTVSSL